MIISPADIRELQILKYYRLVRKWACKSYGLKEADLELLIYLDCVNRFTINDFKNAVYIYSWDKKRWDRLRQNGWVDVWRHRNRTTIKYSIFKTSYKTKQLINRIYRILLSQEDVPTSDKNIFYRNKTYTDKVFNKALNDMINDKNR
jgi:hypothetical protein